MTPTLSEMQIFWRARQEYALALRGQGLTFRAIGDRLGVSLERARQMVCRAERVALANARRLQHARTHAQR